MTRHLCKGWHGGWRSARCRPRHGASCIGLEDTPWPGWRTKTVWAAPRWRSALKVAPRRRMPTLTAPRQCHVTGREGAWGGEGRRRLDDLPVSRQTRGRCLAVLVGNPSHSYHPEGFYPGARPPDIEEVHCVWQWCICPSQAAPLAQGGALDGWRAGWARPDED